MESRLRLRRLVVATLLVLLGGFFVSKNDAFWQATPAPINHTAHAPAAPQNQAPAPEGEAAAILATLDVKGRAPKTGYSRTQFGGVWTSADGTCDARNVILHRDMTDVVTNDKCQVMSGILHDPYTGKTINFVRGPQSSEAVQIDHVVAISNAWQTGAQQLDLATRKAMYVDPLELLAVDGATNNQKGDGDAATWLPPNKAFRCQYVARQIAVKAKYHLWVTPPEKSAMHDVLATCPGQTIPDGALGK